MRSTEKLIDLLRMDLAWSNYVDGKPVPPKWGWMRIAKSWVTNSGFRAVFLYRLAHRSYRKGGRVMPEIYRRWMVRSCGCEIGSSAEIAGGLRLAHPHGISIGGDVKIESMVKIGQLVSIGGNFMKTDETSGRTQPHLGERCQICIGAVVVGPVEVGEHSIVGANSVVMSSIQPYSVVLGNPARVIRKKANDEEDLVG